MKIKGLFVLAGMVVAVANVLHAAPPAASLPTSQPASRPVLEAALRTPETLAEFMLAPAVTAPEPPDCSQMTSLQASVAKQEYQSKLQEHQSKLADWRRTADPTGRKVQWLLTVKDVAQDKSGAVTLDARSTDGIVVGVTYPQEMTKQLLAVKKDNLVVVTGTISDVGSQTPKGGLMDVRLWRTSFSLTGSEFKLADEADIKRFKASRDDPADAAKGRFYGIGGNAECVVFVIDHSGSVMEEFDGIRAELKKSIFQLTDKQQFHVLFFSKDTCEEFTPKRLVPATEENKRDAVKYLSTVTANGYGSSPIPALAQAFKAFKAFSNVDSELPKALPNADSTSPTKKCPLCRDVKVIPCQSCLASNGAPSGLGRCDSCTGSGKMKCPECGGDWGRACVGCKGSGRVVSGYRQEGMFRTPITADCRRCDGVGYLDLCRNRGAKPGQCVKGIVRCSDCGGSCLHGPCPKCNGAKDVPCPRCQASVVRPAGAAAVPAIASAGSTTQPRAVSPGKVLYLLSDGDFDMSGYQYRPPGGSALKGNEAVVAWLRDNNKDKSVHINVIILGEKPTSEAEEIMTGIAKDNGGKYTWIEKGN